MLQIHEVIEPIARFSCADARTSQVHAIVRPILKGPIMRIAPLHSQTRLTEGMTMRATTQPRLRLFDPDQQKGALSPRQKKVRLGEILNVLTEAARHDRTWLTDFADDEIRISADLYEVLTTYRRLRPSA